MTTVDFMPLNDLNGLLSTVTIKQLAASLFFLLAIYNAWMVFYNVSLHPLRGVPGPLLARASPLWQLYKHFILDQPFAIKAAHERYGPVIRIAPNELHFASPTALRQIYTQGKGAPLKTEFYQAARFVNEQNIFSFTDKNMHLDRKRIMSRCFSTSHQIKFVHGVTQLTIQLNDLISKKTRESGEKVVDLYDILNQFTFESVYLLSFEESLGMMKTGEDDILVTLKHNAEKSFVWGLLFPLMKKYGHLLPGPPGSYLRRMRDWKEIYIERMRKLQKSEESPFLSQLLNTASEALNRPLNYSEVAEELMGLMFAGSETTAATMNWLLWELALNPQVQEQLFEEIRQILPSPTAPVDFKLATTLPFLKAVINETLRLHPAIFGSLPRIAITDMVINGQVVPRGTVIAMSNVVHHFDPEYFPEPDKWIPSRWLSKDTTKMMSAFSPFSTGPRVCIGQNLALSEMNVLVPSLCRRFRFSIPEGRPEPDMSPTGLSATHPRGMSNPLRIDERTD